MLRSPRSNAVVGWAALGAALILVAGAAIAIWLGLPPRVVLMSSGQEGSEHQALAERYSAILKRSGVELRLLPSAGSVETLQRLNDARSGVAVGFAQGGLTDEVKSPELVSLGAMFFEPLWFFTHVPIGSTRYEGLRGKRVSIGELGSGTRALTERFMTLNGLVSTSADLRALSTAQAGEALLRGDIDAALMVAPWSSPTVHQLLQSAEIDLVSFARADAYVALSPFLTKLRLPTGVGNLATNRPPTDVDLIAPKTSLIVRRNLHPAIQYLLLEAAAEVHSAPGIFQQSGRFPAAERDDLPLSKSAQQFYKTGTPFLQRYLPFWLAVLVSRVLVILIPAVALAYPVLSATPQLLTFNVRRRILQLYAELRHIRMDFDSSGRGASADALARLQRCEERALQLHVPLQVAHQLTAILSYARRLREHIVSTASSDEATASPDIRSRSY